MARPKSEDKRSAILDAATRVIAAQGLGAPTAMIAQEAGIANGSLFTYFETKTDLFNQLYREIKTGMASAAMAGLPADGDLHAQLFRLWLNWTDWAISYPERRRALAQLTVSDEITPASKEECHKAMDGIAALLARVHAAGPMRDVSMAFVFAIMNSVAEATMDFMVQDPDNAEKHCKAGFDALWRMIA